jgi:hypothetical protein
MRTDTVKSALWGAIGGAVALAIIGFSWGGWVTGGSAERTAKTRSEAAVVTALAPICKVPDAAAQQAILIKQPPGNKGSWWKLLAGQRCLGVRTWRREWPKLARP